MRYIPPDPSETEISVFGARKGECIVIHADGLWFVVDSFRVKSGASRLPVAVEYLSRLNVTSLYGLFITHWHDDHSAGAADVLKAFTSSLQIVGLPNGSGARELASLIADLLPFDLRAALIRDILDTISALGDASASHIRPVTLNDGVILSPPAATNWRLEALSPSYEDQRHHLSTLAQFLPTYKGTRPVRFDVNSGSAVLRFECNGLVAILSSDLDTGESEKRGWRAIVAYHGAALPCHIVKVGHHGSRTALHKPAWALFGKLGKPAAVVTPFPAAGGALPRDKQIRILSALTSTFHLSGLRKGASTTAGLVPSSDTPFATYTPIGSLPLDAVGQVRFRKKTTDPRARVEVFPPSHSLK